MKPGPLIQALDELGSELDRESWEWLSETYPRMADAVQTIVARGASPDQLRAFVIRRCGVNRIELARRIESAARHLEAEK